MPNFAGRGAPGLGYAAAGLTDMLAGALRGGTKAALGLPGDLESLFRSKTTFPTTEDWDKRLPPLNPLTGANWNTAEKLGEFVPAPSLFAVPKAAKAVSSALRTTPVSESAQAGRRSFLTNVGAGAGALALGTSAPSMLAKALRAATGGETSAGIATARAAPVAARLAALKAAWDTKNQLFHKADDLGNAETWGTAWIRNTPDEALAHLRDSSTDFANKSDEELLQIMNRLQNMDSAVQAQQGTKVLPKAFKDVKPEDWDNEVVKRVISGEIDPTEYKPGAFNDIDWGMTDYFDARGFMWGHQ